MANCFNCNEEMGYNCVRCENCNVRLHLSCATLKEKKGFFGGTRTVYFCNKTRCQNEASKY